MMLKYQIGTAIFVSLGDVNNTSGVIKMRRRYNVL